MMRLLFVLLSFVSGGQAADLPALHNMIVFGNEKIYVSHLPMYEHDVHRYQAIYEVTFGDEADRRYREEKKTTKSKIFGISPQKKFVMPSLHRESQFPAGLHPGHPEAVPSTSEVEVTIRRITHFHPLKREGERPKKLTYVKVGTDAEGEVYLAHLLTTPTKGIDTPPDQFDQIVRIKRALQPGTLEELVIPDGALITVSTQDTFSRRLVPTPDSKHFTAAEITSEAGTVPVLLHVASEEYLHTGGDVRVEE